MKTLFAGSKDRKHVEIISRLDRIIALLGETKTGALVSKAVAATAKEYYTNKDMLAILRVTKRTLARYRQKNLVPYYMISGKCYYKVSDVEQFLKRQNTM